MKNKYHKYYVYSFDVYNLINARFRFGSCRMDKCQHHAKKAHNESGYPEIPAFIPFAPPEGLDSKG